MSNLLTTEELAQKWRMSIGHVRRKVRLGQLPYKRLGRRILFDEQNIERLAASE